MSLRAIRSPLAKSISVSEIGDVRLWPDDTFSGEPEILGDFSIGDVSNSFGYRTAADIPPEVIHEAWWAELRGQLLPDEYWFVRHVIEKQQLHTQRGISPFRLYGLRTSHRTQSVRLAMRVGAYDKDVDAWRRLHGGAWNSIAVVEIVDQFFDGNDPGFPITILEFWWDISCLADLNPPAQKELLGLHEEFKDTKYARRALGS